MPGTSPLPKQWSPESIALACLQALHPEAIEGIKRFNDGLYFEAHESLETAWRDETGTLREVYRGILLAGVTLLHIQRNNYSGALKVSERCLNWLQPWPDVSCGIHVGPIKQQIKKVHSLLLEKPTKDLCHFDLSFITQIIYDPAWPIAKPPTRNSGEKHD